ncbi:YciI family protein [Erwinia sp. MMLR14_017]|uniref:YciI family protein n=1 Tax=Erwinia sp. MMLR14_017 TaxID=3093842 RepID=UPI00298F51C3|nr:YciI family protein [Erwinia sp. MMLR14_017]MDW8845691.1 YciI family protein [Erwinia sp. MMLR14_017]
MYIVSLSYTRPMDEVDAVLDAHMAWLDKYFAAGVFITAGRKEPRTGGVILARNIDRERLNTILQEDAFQAVAEYEVTEINITRAADEFKALIGS